MATRAYLTTAGQASSPEQGAPTSTDALPAKRANPAWLLVVAGFAVPLVFCRLGLDAHHDGIMFKPALDVAQGRMLFRDTFSQYGALTTLLQAAAIKLFGERLLSIRLLTALSYGASLLVFARVWSRLLPRRLVSAVYLAGIFLAPYLMYFFLPWSSVYALFFQGLALLLAVRNIENGRRLDLFLSGVAAAAAHWCRQPVGIFLVLALVIGLATIHGRIRGPRYLIGQSGWLRAGRSVAFFVAGEGCLTGCLLLWLASRGALRDWWKQSFELAYEFGRRRGGGYAVASVLRALVPRNSERAWSVIALLSAAQCLWSLSRMLFASSLPSDSSEAKVALAGLVAVSSWPQFFPVTCVNHCYWAAVPMFGVAAYLLVAVSRSPRRFARAAAWTVVAALGLLLYSDVLVRAGFAAEKIRESTAPIRGLATLGGLRVPAKQAADYETLAAIIDEYRRFRPEGTIITTTPDALYPALQSLQAAYHPMYVDWENSLTTLYPEARYARDQYALRAGPLVVGSYDRVDFDRIARIGDRLDVFAARGTVPRTIFVCRESQPSTTRFEIEVVARQAGIIRSALVERVKAQRILAQGWDTIPGTGQPGLFLLSAGSSVGPKANTLAMKVQPGQSLRLRLVGETSLGRDVADDILVSLCLEDFHCQRQSALVSR